MITEHHLLFRGRRIPKLLGWILQAGNDGQRARCLGLGLPDLGGRMLQIETIHRSPTPDEEMEAFTAARIRRYPDFSAETGRFEHYFKAVFGMLPEDLEMHARVLHIPDAWGSRPRAVLEAYSDRYGIVRRVWCNRDGTWTVWAGIVADGMPDSLEQGTLAHQHFQIEREQWWMRSYSSIGQDYLRTKLWEVYNEGVSRLVTTGSTTRL